MPPVVSIVGKSDSGKTTLLEKLIPALVARGIRVGTIKHHAHVSDFDTEGKDTWRHRQAGAAAVCLSGPKQVVTIRDVETPPDVWALAESHFPTEDLVLTEGYKSADAPKVEIFRVGVHDTPLCGPGDSLIAMVTDAKLRFSVPVFGLDDANQLADFLIAHFGLG